MGKLSHLAPRDVFGYFEELTQIPRGSGDMEKISRFCLDFAEKHGLEAYRDEADNVVIKKPASEGYENAETVILQGHLDMVCEKENDCSIDFSKDGLDIYVDDDFVKDFMKKDEILFAINAGIFNTKKNRPECVLIRNKKILIDLQV